MKKLPFIILLLFSAGNLFSGYWVEPMVVNPDSLGFWWGGDNVDMTWDSTGRVWASWVIDTIFPSDFYSSVVKTSYYNGENWLYPYFLHIGPDTTFAYNNFNSMTTDKEGNTWIIWHHGGFALKKNGGKQPPRILYSIFSDSEWSDPSIIGPPSDLYANITALNSSTDTSGMIWVGWVLDWYDMHNLWFWQGLYSAYYLDSTWQKEIVQDNLLNPYLSEPAFVPESSGIRIFYAYEESSFIHPDTLLYGIETAYNTGDGWSNFEILYEDTNVSITNNNPTAEIDTVDRLWVVWKHTGNLYAKYRESGVWSDLKNIGSGSQPSMKTDGYGRTWLIRSGPSVSYLEDTSFAPFQNIGGGCYPELSCDVIGNIWAVWHDYCKVYASFYRRDSIPPQVTVIYPNGGESFNYGDTITIKWTAADEDTVVWVNIYFSSNGGNSYELISEFEKNDSTYEWTIPDVYSDRCLIKITAIDKGYNAISDESDTFFTIHGTGVKEEPSSIERMQTTELHLYPNPCRGRAVIELLLDQTIRKKDILLKIYDISGREVYSFLPSDLHDGTLVWLGVDNAGKPVPPGIYFCRMQTTTDTKTVKFLYMR